MTGELLTLDQLIELVDRDKNDHVLKDIARAFIEAANDWPTYNQTAILDFVMEFKEFYGDPLTKERISNKPIDLREGNAWRHEAGASIIVMLDLSEPPGGQNDFDEMLRDVLGYYSGLSDSSSHVPTDI